MKILMSTDSCGGVWQYSAELVNQLSRAGHEFVLTVMGGRLSEAQRAELDPGANVELHESDYRLEWMQDPWSDVVEARAWIASLAVRTRCELMHLNSFGPAAEPLPLPALLVVHSCVLSWWHAVHGADAGPQWASYRDCVRAALGNARRVVTISQASRRALHACHGGSAPRQVGVIHNGIDAVNWPCGHAGAREALVLGVGRVRDPARNLMLLARIAEELPCPVLIAGERGDGAPAGSRFLGVLARPELAALYRRARVLAHPARYEPFGLSVLEAALSGCALVLGDIAPLRELWGDAAMYVRPDDASGLGNTLAALVTDEPRCRALGTLARRRALRYGAARMAAHYRAVYRGLLGIGAGRHVA